MLASAAASAVVAATAAHGQLLHTHHGQQFWLQQPMLQQAPIWASSQIARPAAEGLTAGVMQVNKVDLQRVRSVKSTMNKLMGRVGRVKQASSLHCYHTCVALKSSAWSLPHSAAPLKLCIQAAAPAHHEALPVTGQQGLAGCSSTAQRRLSAAAAPAHS